MLAVRTGLSQSTISRIWRAFGLKPHRTESFQLSTDPLLIDKVRDIVGHISIHPIMRWCCAWMKISRSRHSAVPSLCCPCGPDNGSGARPTTRDMASPACLHALDIATGGNVAGKCYRRHRSVEFLDFLKKIDTAVQSDLDIHLVLDNYGTLENSAGPPVATKKITVSPALHSLAWHLLAQLGVNASSHCLHNGRSSAVHTTACRNSKRRSANSSLPTTNSPNPFDGPSPQTRSWPPSLDSLLLLSPRNHPQPIREINDSGDWSRSVLMRSIIHTSAGEANVPLVLGQRMCLLPAQRHELRKKSEIQETETHLINLFGWWCSAELLLGCRQTGNQPKRVSRDIRPRLFPRGSWPWMSALT